MRIEALCTGDELLTGVTADTNTPLFAAALLRMGEVLSRTTVVGDDLDGIAQALTEAAARADLLLVSGGLGPTDDDLTVEAAARAAGVKVVHDEATLSHLRELARVRGSTVTPENARQARVPEGSEVAQNPVGSAPFFSLRLQQCTCFFVPGVPREYRALLEREVLPRIARLRSASGVKEQVAFRILKTIAVPESQLGKRVAKLAPAHPSVRFGWRTDAPENHVELLARGQTLADAQQALAAAEAACRAELGEDLFAADDETLPGVVLQLLRKLRHTVTFAESCTGGLVAGLFTRAPGASDVFPGSAVTYAERFKADWADVPEAVISDFGVVSAPVAEHMAEGLRARAHTTWAVSVTGYAGPTGGTEKEPVGAVYIAVAGPSGTTCTRHLFYGERERIRAFAAWTALDLLRRRLLREGREG